MDKSAESKENEEQWCDSVEPEPEKKEFLISLESDTLSSGSSVTDGSQACSSNYIESKSGKRFRCASTSSDTSEQIPSCLTYDPIRSHLEDEPLPLFKIPPRRQLDENTIQRRTKQIEYGKNTAGYYNYRKRVPKNKRKKTDPRTPDIHAVKSRRCFDNEVKNWRRALHLYDSEEEPKK